MRLLSLLPRFVLTGWDHAIPGSVDRCCRVEVRSDGRVLSVESWPPESCPDPDAHPERPRHVCASDCPCPGCGVPRNVVANEWAGASWWSECRCAGRPRVVAERSR